jgi:rSAM/selenodomain-associated transferase 1
MSKAEGVLCIFTKTPLDGQVKTRLIPSVGEKQATNLYKDLLIRTLETASSSSVSRIRLYCTPTIEHPFLTESAEKFNIELCLQQGEDLGTRMCNALNEGLNEFDYALVLGCDCPWLSTADLEQACAGLSKANDLVLGPAKDGGYYLLGLRSPQDYLFENMHWGQAGVLAETRQRLQKAGQRWFELNEYQDIDRPEDLPAYDKLRHDCV